MIVMAFDLSSTCIGVVTARLNGTTVEKIMSCPIIPPSFDPVILGYKHSKKKLPTRSGELLNTYFKEGEVSISKAEKQRRDDHVRAQKDIFVLSSIGKSLANLMDNIKPDLILVEKNAIFNGILTSILLAKVMGTLLGLAGRLGTPVKEYSVTKARSVFNVGREVVSFSKTQTEDELRKIPDITKRALGVLMNRKYGIVFKTDDESDACVLFNYWYEKEVLLK